MKLLTIRMCILELNFVVIIKYQNCTYEFSLIIWEKNELLKFQYFFNYNFVLRSRTKLLNTCIKCLDFNDLLYYSFIIFPDKVVFKTWKNTDVLRINFIPSKRKAIGRSIIENKHKIDIQKYWLR